MFLKKTRRNREEAGLSLIRHEHIYQAIKEEHKEHNYPIAALCKLGRVSRASYYKWLHREIPESEQKNRLIADEIEKIHTESPDKGYRRIRDDLERYHGIDVNDKRVLRICRKLNIKSTI
ncbi:IS3 family transposase, partial [[Ruminococcus] torques]|uniref:IS3 family transposase n=2 Tax=Mediterraneibacter TaxID=2316020 RepID=UPI0035668583